MGRLFGMTGLFAALFLLMAPIARAQSPSPDQLGAAKELIATMHLVDQFKAIMPSLVKALKPAIVQGRSDVERDYDAMMPALLEAFAKRFDELVEAVAIIYASNFSAEDLRALNSFYKTPAGQQFLQKAPLVTQQSMTAGQKFGQSVAAEMRGQIIDGLRQKGHDL